MVSRPGLDFSFSGLKTFAMNTWLSSQQQEVDKANIAYAFQTSVTQTLAIKCKRALKETNLQTLVVAGGVAANSALRHQLNELMKKLEGKVYYPRHEFCTDNGAMVAYAGCCRLLAGEKEALEINVLPRWPL